MINKQRLGLSETRTTLFWSSRDEALGNSGASKRKVSPGSPDMSRSAMTTDSTAEVLGGEQNRLGDGPGADETCF